METPRTAGRYRPGSLRRVANHPKTIPAMRYRFQKNGKTSS